VVDPTQSLAFPVNVIALLPYMLLNFEDANELCIRSAENIAQVRDPTHLMLFFTIYLWAAQSSVNVAPNVDLKFTQYIYKF